MNWTDAWRSWRRDLKARLPYVRRREHLLLERRYAALIDGLGWTAPLATGARLTALRRVAPGLTGEVCFFVSFAAEPQIKRHVISHIEHLLDAQVQVVLVLNTDLAPDQFEMAPDFTARLSGLYVRENSGFDFAAWAHLFAICEAQVARFTRLYLVNDSIVGPLETPAFEQLMHRLRDSAADVVGLTQSRLPRVHIQSFFLMFNARAIRHPELRRIFDRVLSLPDKTQVIDVYETMLTRKLTAAGLRCEALFEPLSSDLHSSNDTSFRWDRLISSGFPYIKASVLEKHAGSPRIKALVPARFIPPGN